LKRSIIGELRSDFAFHGKNLRNPGFWVLAMHRVGCWASNGRGAFGVAGRALDGVLRAGTKAVLQSSIDPAATLGEGLHLIHGVIRIGGGTVIGRRVGIMHDVTIGPDPGRPGEPVIGDDVFIGPGAKILGPVTIGDNATVAANSVVVSDVPPRTIAIGIPAKVLRYTGKMGRAGAVEPPAAPPPPASEADEAP
jgi:serine O-acetyltransferase